MNIINYLKNNFYRIPALIINVLTFILGFVCLCFSSYISSIFVYVVGVMILIPALMYLIYGIIKWNEVPFPVVDIIFSSLIIMLTIWAILNPKNLLKIFISGIGIYTIISSIKWLVSAYYKYITHNNWWQDGIVGFFELIVGIIILFNPFSTLRVAFVILGIYLMVISVYNVYVNYKGKKKM